MATSVTAAITQFQVVAAAVLPPSFNIRYGTQWSPNPANQALMISDIHFSMDDFAELGPTYRHEEHYAFVCSICSAAGNDDEATRMTESYGFFNSVSVAVANNPTLNGVVRIAHTKQLEYCPTYDAFKGWSIGVLRFEVLCEQRVNSLT